METITATTVNATPRAESFTYFSGNGTITRKTTTEQSPIAQDDGSIILLNDLPETGNEGTLYIIRDNKLCYVYENGAFQLVASLTKIVAGRNISISPTTGLGDVTVTAADPPVTKIVAGSNVSISPTTGLGDVTVNAASPGVTKLVAGTNITLSPTTGLGDVTVTAANAPVTKIVAGTGVTISPTTGLGDVTVSINETWLTNFVNAIVNP